MFITDPDFSPISDPDPGVKKALDSGSGTLLEPLEIQYERFCSVTVRIYSRKKLKTESHYCKLTQNLKTGYSARTVSGSGSANVSVKYIYGSRGKSMRQKFKKYLRSTSFY